MSRFFFPVPPQNSFFFSSLLGSFRGILVVFEAPGRSNVHVWSSRAVVCEARRPGLVGPPVFHTTVREPKRAGFSGRCKKLGVGYDFPFQAPDHPEK